MRADLKPFVEELPWLRDLGEDTLARLDSGDWHQPGDHTVRERRHALESALEAHVMAYRQEAQGVSDALAMLVEPAQLTDEQLALLRQTEQQLGNCVFVAFARPLKRRPGTERPRRQNRRKLK